MLRNLFLFSCFSLIFIFTMNAQVPQSMTGNWEGLVNEGERSSPYHVKLDVEVVKKGEVAGKIWYRAYNCGGTLTYLGINENGIHFFKENLTTKGDCIQGGIIAAHMVDGKFGFIWSHEDYSHQAKGLLYRPL